MKNTLSILLLLTLSIGKIQSQCFVKNQRTIASFTVYDETDDYYVNSLYEDANELIKKVILLDVKYGFYNDYKSPNAMAMPIDSYTFDGQIYFGEALINDLITNHKALTNSEKFENLFIIITVLAHEYAHVLQYKNNHLYTKTMYSELQADYIAGFYIGYYSMHLKAKKYWNYRTDALRLFEQLGDTNFGSLYHHGTPLQRSFSFAAGFNVWNDYSQSEGIDYYNVPDNSFIWNKSIQFIHYWYGDENDFQTATYY